jgi:peptidylprolyl isomerase
MSKGISTRREALRAARARRRIVNRIVTIAIVLLVVALVTLSIISARKQAQSNQVMTPTDMNIQEPTHTVAIPTTGGSIPMLVGTKLYSSAPPFLLDMTKQYTATVKMAEGGEFIIQLYPNKAPITVNSFVFLAREGFFNGVTFHRVLEGFMAQGGDPLGTGMGGPGYEFVNELNDLKFDIAGVVAMANAGPGTNGSQFFITFGPVGLSENDYTIFGQVISGMDVVNKITLRDPSQIPSFTGDVIQSIVINEK